MKYILIALSFFISLNAYELNGDLGVKWTGFKTEKKVAVSGTFKDIQLDIKKADDLSSFLKSANVEIKTASFDSKNPFRDKNITSTLFSLATSKLIKGSISSVNEKTNELTLNVTMNEVTKEVTMKYELNENKIVAKGSIDVLNFAMEKPYLEFAKKCAGFHANKSYSNVDIEFTIPYK